MLGNKVMVGTVNANREYFELGVRDMAQAEAEYPGWLARLLTHPVKGLDNYRELIDTLTTAKGAIKVYCEVLTVARDPRTVCEARRREAGALVSERRRRREASPRRGSARAQAGATWRRWGPYLSERQWGTVREDYCPDGDAWDYFPHDHARSRAYRWGEDGIAGISDDQQRLCFALALWNGRDPILKERLFGLTGSRGQPRRGRQGVLLLPRRHADPLLHARCSTSTRRRAFPYARPRRGEPPPRPDAAGVRAGRHRRLRRGPLLRRASSSTPRPSPTTS